MTNLPVTGTFKVSCEYLRKGNLWSSGYHKGIDITCNNRSIYCTCDGVVKTVGFDADGWGQYVRVEEKKTKRIHIFCHLVKGSVKVKVGQAVSRATILGVMGTTGNSTGVHLHFQIEKSNTNRTVCDPTEWLGIPNKKGTYNSKNYQIDTAKNKETKKDTTTTTTTKAQNTLKDSAKIANWAKTHVNKVVASGIMVGDDQGNFRPDDFITRAEMSVVICRGWKNSKLFSTVSKNASKPFKDVVSTAWYYKYVEACRKAGIIRGDADGNCNPSNSITRQDAIVMIMRMKYTDAQLAKLNVNALVKKSGVNPTDFDKVSNYAKPAMAAALGSLINGDGNGAINPLKAITRQEMAVILVRALKL